MGDFSLYRHYIVIMQNEVKTLVEYVWIGGEQEVRCKTRVMSGEITTLEQLPVWNFDGSSTKQAEGHYSEVLINPVALFSDPFRKEHHKIVFCETLHPDGTPHKTNNRHWANKLFNQALHEKPWFGLEQEYFMMNTITGNPLGIEGAKEQGQYYCSAGAKNAFGREIAEEHLAACIHAGIRISGINAEVAPGQWEYQIGPCVGIEEGDHLWMARYLLERVAEKYGVSIDIEPKPVKGDWNGSGCHANYSTQNMREGCGEKTGLEYIHEAIEKLSENHTEHMEVYGLHNDERMSGAHETADYHTFSSGIANRGASVRIGNDVSRDKKGYFEDRRPGSNCDPYLVTGMLFKTTVL